MNESQREEFEAFMAERFPNSIDRRRCINGDGNDYMSWDMGVARTVWQHMQQKQDAIVDWRAGRPVIDAGTSKRFWVTHKLQDGSLKVTDLIFFNCPAPDDEDEFCDAEMTTPDGDPYWPEGWHDLCTHPDFDYCYQQSDLKVLAYAEFVKPEPAKDGE